jgi:hypothetical protein
VTAPGSRRMESKNENGINGYCESSVRDYWRALSFYLPPRKGWVLHNPSFVIKCQVERTEQVSVGKAGSKVMTSA